MQSVAVGVLRAGFGLTLLLGLCRTALADGLPPTFQQAGIEVEGALDSGEDSVTFTRKRSWVRVTPADPSSFRLELDVELAPTRGTTELALGPAESSRNPEKATWRATIRRTDGDAGEALAFQPMVRSSDGAWTRQREAQRSFRFAPRSPPRPPLGLVSSWKKQWWKLGIERSGDRVRVTFDGQTVLAEKLHAPAASDFVLRFSAGDRVRGLRTGQPRSGPFVQLELGKAATLVGKTATADELTIAGIPFKLAQQGRAAIELSAARWPEWKQDPSSSRESYDATPTRYPDPERPMLWAPTADYGALHLLVSAGERHDQEPYLSAIIGSFGVAGQVRHYAYEANVPRAPLLASAVVPIAAAKSAVTYLRIPLHEPLQEVLPDVLQIAFNKRLRLAVRQPDPSRFRYRPLGLPSSVAIWAATLELSPLQMTVRCDEPGNAFVDPALPAFVVKLSNPTAHAQRYLLKAVATHLDGHRLFQEQSGELPGGRGADIVLRTPVVRRGYYDYRIELRRPSGELLLAKSTSFAWLMPRPKSDRAASPFGTWDFSGAHFTSADPALVGALYKKLGFRYGMFRFTPEQRAAAFVVQGREPMVLGSADNYFAFRKQHPDAALVALLLHEQALSSEHAHRVPDLFHDRGEYRLASQERAQLDKLFSGIESAARALRAADPRVHLRLGNGGLPMKEELYRQGFPSELFDSAGNEAAVFGRPPEAQPPDSIAMNASLWMDRRLLDHYGYSDKPVTQCFETCYPSSNPGNLSLETQADYFVRHALHALAWRLPAIRLGLIMDAGNSYYHSNWGAAGLCTATPEVRVKPAFVAMATLTTVLAGAKFERVLELGSPSMYALEFSRPDGDRVWALWTLRGRRSLALRVTDGASALWKLTDAQGNAGVPQTSANELSVSLGTSPVYLQGRGRVEVARAGEPDHRDALPSGASLVATFETLDDWVVEKGRDINLEFHNPMTPRTQGAFDFQPLGEIEGKRGVVRIVPGSRSQAPDTMPRYGGLRHRRGLTLPGRPTAIGLWVNGNSGFGRVIFELEDAAGQRWTSIGASGRRSVPANQLALVPKALATYQSGLRLADWNSDDVFGLSRFNFDGWRYLSFPLPGNYPGEGYGWPANSQWMHDGSGQVRYPLRLRKLFFELPDKTLHVTTFAPPPRSAVYIADIHVQQGDADWRAPTANGVSLQ